MPVREPDQRPCIVLAQPRRGDKGRREPVSGLPVPITQRKDVIPCQTIRCTIRCGRRPIR